MTRPVASTVATEVLEDVQAFTAAGVPLPVNCVVDPRQMEVVPVMIGRAFTVTVTVVPQPLLSV